MRNVFFSLGFMFVVASGPGYAADRRTYGRAAGSLGCSVRADMSKPTVDQLPLPELSELVRRARKILAGADHDPASWTKKQRAQIKALLG